MKKFSFTFCFSNFMYLKRNVFRHFLGLRTFFLFFGTCNFWNLSHALHYVPGDMNDDQPTTNINTGIESITVCYLYSRGSFFFTRNCMHFCACGPATIGGVIVIGTAVKTEKSWSSIHHLAVQRLFVTWRKSLSNILLLLTSFELSGGNDDNFLLGKQTCPSFLFSESFTRFPPFNKYLLQRRTIPALRFHNGS